MKANVKELEKSIRKNYEIQMKSNKSNAKRFMAYAQARSCLGKKKNR